MKALYYGDNLQVLRDSVEAETIDLIYLDPPFNSSATYNVLFRSPAGDESQAQIEAFEDTWHWTDEAERAFDEAMHSGNTGAADLLNAMRSFLGENDMMAYLTMMAVRLLKLHRVLKPTGSLYLHCDPTASHYLKTLMDAVFGPQLFKNEIIWKRTFAHGSAVRWGDVHDVILFYSKSTKYTWNKPLQAHDEQYLDNKYRHHDERGRYRLVVLTGSGIRQGASGEPWRGYNPTESSRHWAVPRRALATLEEEGIDIPEELHEQLELLFEHGFIRFPRKSDGSIGVPEFKLYLAEGQPVQDVILDIPPINSRARERLGYPTQKPTALLERILEASSSEGDLVLDPFCGCGTTIHAAQKLGRNWIGIDVTHLAISLIEKRLNDAFPGISFEVHGTPKDLEGARALAEFDKYQFQWWAVSLVNAVPVGGKKKGADQGIDGVIYFKPDGKKTERAVVSVKGGRNVSVAMIRDLKGVMQRENSPMGLFVTLANPTAPMKKEAASAGVLDTPFGKYTRLQILTIEDLFAGRNPAMPPQDLAAFKKAAREEDKTRQGRLI